MNPKFEAPDSQDNINFHALRSNHPDSDFVSFSLADCEEAQQIKEQYSYAQIPQYSLRIKDLPISERPRDRLMMHGAKSLSTSELLSILLGTGQGAGGLSAVGLGQHILQQLSESQQDPLEMLRDITVQELMSVPGVGTAKATTILAAIELGKRVYHLRPPERTVIDDPASAVAVLSNELMWQPQERFATLLLDVKNRLMGHQVISVGTATETLSHPRDIFREVIRRGAVRVIVAHNHPSGVVEPSQDDIQITRQLLQGAQFLNIPLLDHLILGCGSFTSLRQTTSLWQEFPQGD